MNTDILQGKWRQLKGEARVQWGKLTDDDLDQVQGQAEKLVGLVQERYGYDRQRDGDGSEQREDRVELGRNGEMRQLHVDLWT